MTTAARQDAPMMDSARRADPKGGGVANRTPGHPGIKCPSCGARARIRTSRRITPRFVEYRLRCENEIDCGRAFVASLTIDREV